MNNVNILIQEKPYSLISLELCLGIALIKIITIPFMFVMGPEFAFATALNVVLNTPVALILADTVTITTPLPMPHPEHLA